MVAAGFEVAGWDCNDWLPPRVELVERASRACVLSDLRVETCERAGVLHHYTKSWKDERRSTVPRPRRCRHRLSPAWAGYDQPTFRRRQSCSQSTAGRHAPTPPPPTDEQLWKDYYQRRSMSVGAFPPGRDGSPSYSQITRAKARVQGFLSKFACPRRPRRMA